MMLKSTDLNTGNMGNPRIPNTRKEIHSKNFTYPINTRLTL